MRRHLTPLMVAVAIGLSLAVPPPPAGSPASTSHPPAGTPAMAPRAGFLPGPESDGPATPEAGTRFTPAAAGGRASAQNARRPHQRKITGATRAAARWTVSSSSTSGSVLSGAGGRSVVGV